MLIINVEKSGSVDKALKIYKKKYKSTRVVEELRDRKTFAKPSEKRRDEKKKAIFREKWRNSNMER
jgi:small subunit ribosomal protein S21